MCCCVLLSFFLRGFVNVSRALPSPAGRYGASPDTNHDDRARFNFLAQLKTHLATHVAPGNAHADEKRVKPEIEATHGRAPADRHDVRRAMLKIHTSR